MATDCRTRCRCVCCKCKCGKWSHKWSQVVLIERAGIESLVLYFFWYISSNSTRKTELNSLVSYVLLSLSSRLNEKASFYRDFCRVLVQLIALCVCNVQWPFFKYFIEWVNRELRCHNSRPLSLSLSFSKTIANSQCNIHRSFNYFSFFSRRKVR